MQFPLYTNTTPTFVAVEVPAAVQSSAQSAYWHGFDLRVAEVFDGVVVITDDLMPDELRGYRFASRMEADSDTDVYLAQQPAAPAPHHPYAYTYADYECDPANDSEWLRTGAW